MAPTTRSARYCSYNRGPTRVRTAAEASCSCRRARELASQCSTLPVGRSTPHAGSTQQHPPFPRTCALAIDMPAPPRPLELERAWKCSTMHLHTTEHT